MTKLTNKIFVWFMGASFLFYPYIMNADLFTGVRTVTDGGVTATGGWSKQNFSVSWNINVDNATHVINPNNVNYHYIYNIGLLDSNGNFLKDSKGNIEQLTKAISHFILQISSNASMSDFFFATKPDENATTYTSTSNGNSNPGLPSPLYGLKFTPTNGGGYQTIEFWTNRPPVWGDFYAKDGVENLKVGKTNSKIDVIAYNTGEGQIPGSNLIDWIARPDTTPILLKKIETSVPEPTTFLLLGSGLAAAAWKKRGRKA